MSQPPPKASLNPSATAFTPGGAAAQSPLSPGSPAAYPMEGPPHHGGAGLGGSGGYGHAGGRGAGPGFNASAPGWTPNGGMGGGGMNRGYVTHGIPGGVAGGGAGGGGPGMFPTHVSNPGNFRPDMGRGDFTGAGGGGYRGPGGAGPAFNPHLMGHGMPGGPMMGAGGGALSPMPMAHPAAHLGGGAAGHHHMGGPGMGPGMLPGMGAAGMLGGPMGGHHHPGAHHPASAGLHHPQHLGAGGPPQPLAMVGAPNATPSVGAASANLGHPPQPKPAILMCGAPRCGKTAVAQKLADARNMVMISFDRNSRLGDNLLEMTKKIRSTFQSKDGYVLDSFACDSWADIFYLFDALKSVGVGVAYVIYFFLEVTSMKKTPPLTAEEMHRHAIAYEICQKNFLSRESQFTLAKCMLDPPADAPQGGRHKPFVPRLKTPDELFTELQADLETKLDTFIGPKIPKNRPLPSGIAVPIPLAPFPFAVERSSELVENYWEFAGILKDLGNALGLDLESAFPPRNVRTPLDYAKFTRFFSALPGYKVSCVTESKRVVWFKHKEHLYYLPESAQHIMKFSAGSVAESMASKTTRVEPWSDEYPIGWAVEAEIIPDDVEDSNGGQKAPTEIPVVRDFLYLNKKRCTGMSREQRAELNPQPPPSQATEGGSNILVTKSFGLSEIESARKFAMRISRTTSVTGYRFDHPGPYIMGRDDPRCFIWYENTPPIVVRLWDAKEMSDGWLFTMYCLQDVAPSASAAASSDDAVAAAGSTQPAAAETLLTGCVVLVDFKTAEDLCINDGQLVEVLYDDSKKPVHTAGPTTGKGAIKPLVPGVFSFSRRRQDLYWPMYLSAIQERLKWKKWEQCRRMCAAVKEPMDTWFEVDGLRTTTALGAPAAK